MTKIEWPVYDSRYMWLNIDVPICRDFILHEEQKLGIQMSSEKAANFIAKQFHFSEDRAKEIVKYIKRLETNLQQ